VALAASPAQALDPGANASAFGVKANVLNGTLVVPPTPTSTFPPGANNSLLNVNLGALGAVGAVNATTTGDSAAGTSSASGSVANVALLGVSATQLPAITADAVDATCSAAAPAAPTGQTTLTNLRLGNGAIVDLHPAANTKLLNLTGLAVITLNEQITNGDGSLTVNAVHVQAGPIVNGTATIADVILGSATCGPNAVTAPVDAFSFGSTPIVHIALAIVIDAGIAVRTGIRRATGKA
jgi:hypothetical protein